MIAENTKQEVNTIEEFTIFSLDKTQEGVRYLINDIDNCASKLKSEKKEEGLQQLFALVEALHDFDIFENALFSFFKDDRTRHSDEKGSLAAVATLFRSSLSSITNKLENNDILGLATVLSTDLKQSLERYKELLPLVKEYINKEYVETCV